MHRIIFFPYTQPKNMEKSAVKGSILLIISGFLCKILGAFFRLPLTKIIGVEGIGVFQMIITLYSFALILCSGGITITLSKLISQARAKADIVKMRSLYKISIIFSVLVGVFIGVIFFIFAKNISILQGNDKSIWGYRLMIILLPLGGIIASLKGVIQGNENMLPTAVSQVIEQSFRFVLGLLFAYFLIPYGIEFGVVGAISGIVIGEIASSIYLFYKVKKLTVRFEGKKYQGFFRTLVPILLGLIIFPLVNSIDSFIIVKRLSIAGFSSENATILFGLQTGIVGAILNIPLIISTSIATAILPAISFISEDETLFNEKVINAFKTLWIVLIPTTIGIICVARPLYMLIYPNLDSGLLDYAVNLTEIGGISTILTALMQFFITILQAKGQLSYLLLIEFFGGVAKVITTIFLCSIPQINIYGIVIANIVLSFIVLVGAILKLKGSVKVSYFDVLVPLVSSVIMFVIVSEFIILFDLPLILTLCLSILIGIFTYIFFSFPCVLDVLSILNLRKNKKQA